jgi:hypothetical protein
MGLKTPTWLYVCVCVYVEYIISYGYMQQKNVTFEQRACEHQVYNGNRNKCLSYNYAVVTTLIIHADCLTGQNG